MIRTLQLMSMNRDILQNPTLYPEALSDAELSPTFKWHSHASSPRSSQVFCLSAFGGLRGLKNRDEILAALLSLSLPDFAQRERERWEILPECEDADLLGEHGSNQPTAVDALCRSRSAIVAIESKFVTDAQSGFGSCSQATRGICAGFYGPGSDKTKESRSQTGAWCRLENWEGRRAPRRYWAMGKRYFRDEVFAMQSVGDVCPFAGPNYQLMRNFLFAAAMAGRSGRGGHFMLTIAPRAFADHLAGQLDGFRKQILRPDFAGRVGFASYEDLAAILSNDSDPQAQRLGSFLLERIREIVGRSGQETPY